MNDYVRGDDIERCPQHCIWLTKERIEGGSIYDPRYTYWCDTANGRKDWCPRESDNYVDNRKCSNCRNVFMGIFPKDCRYLVDKNPNGFCQLWKVK